MAVRRILYPVDLDQEYRWGLPHAAALAKPCGAEVILFHAIDFSDLSRYGYPELRLRERELEAKVRVRAHDFLERVAALPPMKDVAARIDIRFADGVVPTMLDAARDVEADLIVMGTHVRTALGRVVMGSLAERVVHTSDIPVFVCKHPKKGEPPPIERPVEYRRILVPTDFSLPADAAAARAAEIAAAHGSRIEVVHVIEDRPPPVYLLAGIGQPFDPAEFEAQVERKMAERAAVVFEGVDHDVHVLSGRASDAIVDFARTENIDLVAMATLGHDSLGDRFLGSTADRVLRRAPCPVYVFHADPDRPGEGG